MSNETIYQKVTDAIVARLNAGVIPWKQDWKNIGFYPKNLVSKSDYHGANWLLLSSMNYPSPFWCTFLQAKQLGGNVRKGEAALPVIYADKILIDPESGKSISSADRKNGQLPEDARPVHFLKYFNCFNLTQCDNIPESKIPVLTETDRRPAVLSAETIISFYVNGKGCRLFENTTIDSDIERVRAFYRPSSDIIGVPPSSSFSSRDAHYATLFHEMIHSTGHSSRLDRNMTTPFGSPAYAREELTAEIGATYLCALCGITDTTVDSSASYIDFWIKILKADSSMVVQCSSSARKAVEFILGHPFESFIEKE